MLHTPFTQDEITAIMEHFHALETIFKSHGYETLNLETLDVEDDFDEQIHLDDGQRR